MKLSQEYLEYSDNPGKLSEILSEVTIYLDGSQVRSEAKKCHRVWNVRVERNGKSIEFEFHNSIHALDMEEKTTKDWNGRIFKTGRYRNSGFIGLVEKAFRGEDLAYSILCCMGLDGRMDVSNFENWCSILGYDTDSRKALSIYLECQEQANKVLKLFSEEELNCFPS